MYIFLLHLQILEAHMENIVIATLISKGNIGDKKIIIIWILFYTLYLSYMLWNNDL